MERSDAEAAIRPAGIRTRETDWQAASPNPAPSDPPRVSTLPLVVSPPPHPEKEYVLALNATVRNECNERTVYPWLLAGNDIPCGTRSYGFRRQAAGGGVGSSSYRRSSALIARRPWVRIPPPLPTPSHWPRSLPPWPVFFVRRFHLPARPPAQPIGPRTRVVATRRRWLFLRVRMTRSHPCRKLQGVSIRCLAAAVPPAEGKPAFSMNNRWQSTPRTLLGSGSVM